MEDYTMSTPMLTNWRKVDTSREKDVDPTLYRKLIGSLVYLKHKAKYIICIKLS